MAAAALAQGAVVVVVLTLGLAVLAVLALGADVAPVISGIRSLAVVRCSKVYVFIATVTCEICLAKHIMACKTYVCFLLISFGGIEELWTTVIRYARSALSTSSVRLPSVSIGKERVFSHTCRRHATRIALD